MVFHRNAKLGLAGRLALVQAIEGGMSMRAAAAAFSVSPATAHRWWHRWVRGGRSRRARALLVCLIAPADLAAARASSPRSCRSGSAPAAGRRAGGLAAPVGNSRTNSSTPARTASRTRVGSARALVNAQDDQAPHAPVAGHSRLWLSQRSRTATAAPLPRAGRRGATSLEFAQPTGRRARINRVSAPCGARPNRARRAAARARVDEARRRQRSVAARVPRASRVVRSRRARR